MLMEYFIRWNLAKERNKDKEQFSYTELVLLFSINSRKKCKGSTIEKILASWARKVLISKKFVIMVLENAMRTEDKYVLERSIL